MRDLTAKRFNSNNPQSNYIKLQGQIEKLEIKLRGMDQTIIDGMARIRELEERSVP